MEADGGLIDASLGGHLIKKRIAAAGRGKSGSYRTVIAYRAGDRAIFIVGFSKSERSNVSARELESLKRLAKFYFDFDDLALRHAMTAGALIEVKTNE